MDLFKSLRSLFYNPEPPFPLLEFLFSLNRDTFTEFLHQFDFYDQINIFFISKKLTLHFAYVFSHFIRFTTVPKWFPVSCVKSIHITCNNKISSFTERSVDLMKEGKLKNLMDVTSSEHCEVPDSVKYLEMMYHTPSKVKLPSELRSIYFNSINFSDLKDINFPISTECIEIDVVYFNDENEEIDLTYLNKLTGISIGYPSDISLKLPREYLCKIRNRAIPKIERARDYLCTDKNGLPRGCTCCGDELDPYDFCFIAYYDNSCKDIVLDFCHLDLNCIITMIELCNDCGTIKEITLFTEHCKVLFYTDKIPDSPTTIDGAINDIIEKEKEFLTIY